MTDLGLTFDAEKCVSHQILFCVVCLNEGCCNVVEDGRKHDGPSENKSRLHP